MILLLILLSSITTLISLFILRPIAVKYDLVDFPNERKNHTGNIPLVGGICIFFGILVPCVFFIEFDKFSCVLLITASLILIHGMWDDFTNLKAKTKITFQVIISSIMIYVTDVKLHTLGNLFGFFPLELGIFSIPITIISVVGLTNAINMIDGLDGLAASTVLIAILGIVGISPTLEFSAFTSIILVVASALLPFLIFNITTYPKMKVFLGDGGSLFLGYIISWALIYSAENLNNFTHGFALWCVAIPLFDFFAVIILRIVKKHSLVIANKDHIHHFLENLGFSRKLILWQIVFYGLFFLLFGSLIEKYLPTLSFPVFLILFLFYLFIRIYIDSKKIEKY